MQINTLPRHTHTDKLKSAEFSENDLKSIIREMNLKITNQRLTILNSLVLGRQHVTAQEVFEIVNKDHPEIGFATVYRFLRKLVDSNLATEVRMGGLPARYELNPKTHHDHLTCTQCGKICEFENLEIERLQIQVAEYFGFKLSSHVLELYGICPQCQGEAAEKKYSSKQ